VALDKIREKYFDEPLDVENKKFKVDQGMLWHYRLHQASIEYLRKLQKLIPLLKDVKFGQNILDSAVCVLSKM